ncbi:DJ-1/PfpI family protein [Roseibium marinum]|uniref:DJ-1/PfpI family protein n=1 Tax=Roseibium marinum TaxID=281252 RepID=A0A2S3UTG6_9HYPH|nr:DJ-1/PfpI family protein [Roseibium marinum]POF31012.1 DJ-1/PfpI family protein [Roseibium marinum]
MKSIGALVFPGFETLDLFGPLEFFGWLPNEFNITTVGENTGHVTCRSGQRIAVDCLLGESNDYDLLLVPGGPGTPVEQVNEAIHDWIRAASEKAEIVMSVCTGSALLASTGVLDGRKATTNKMRFKWAIQFGPNVDWIGKARWVEDGKFFTSSGVSAGMDMSLAVISRILDRKTARHVAKCAEYSWTEDPSSDPFAVQHEVS